jgi:hypothetical protein
MTSRPVGDRIRASSVKTAETSSPWLDLSGGADAVEQQGPAQAIAEAHPPLDGIDLRCTSVDWALTASPRPRPDRP